MPSELTRIATPSDAERAFINALTPQERKDALVEAGRRKQRRYDRQLNQRDVATDHPTTGNINADEETL